MGVKGFLPRLASVMQNIDLYDCNKDRISAYDDDRRKAHAIGTKRRRPNVGSSEEQNNEVKSTLMRKMRVAVDVSVWIAHACHGNGATFLDERFLSNYGRAQMMRDQIILKQKKANATNLDDVHGLTENEINLTNDGKEQELFDFTTTCVQQVIKKIQRLQHECHMEVLVVLDGASPPTKTRCSIKRRKLREEAAAKMEEIDFSIDTVDIGATDLIGNDFLENGDESIKRKITQLENNMNLTRIKAANRAGAQNSDIYTKVVRLFINSLREEKIPFLVAPYEADGQLGYLSRKKLVDLVISEDSDLIAHGVRNVVYKLDSNDISGKISGSLLRRRDLGANDPNSLCLLDFSDVMIVLMMIAAGCDYCDSLHGVGIITARNAVKQAFYSTKKEPRVLRKLFDNLYLMSRKKNTILESDKKRYESNFLEAIVMYRHPIVFDPMSGNCILNNIDNPDIDLMEYKPYAEIILHREKIFSIVGKLYDRKLGLLIAQGWFNPKVHQVFDHIST
mmetsp:Transcript_10522/g.14853  ORF Transcript_10522/g.14853 Transcript_10522/m.14853 type:complete len:507 (+) Transcript_10522:40-1560(+)